MNTQEALRAALQRIDADTRQALEDALQRHRSDVFILGEISAIKAIIKSREETGQEANDIDFQVVLESLRRELSDPTLEENVCDAAVMEVLK